MSAPTADLHALRTSTTALIRWLEAEQWSDADVGAPSLLPDWTRGHVLTHIARNADGIARTLSGALRGQNVPRYPAGMAGRNADIQAGARRPMSEQLADVRDSADRLDRVFSALGDADPAVWTRLADDRPAGEYALGRWREVEIHRVDLGAGYTPDLWPPAFVSRVLPDVADELAARDGVAALRVEVAAAGSVSTDLAGRVWAVGAPAEATDVVGPDWAVLAWLLGRSSMAAAALSAAPPLPAWR